MPSSGKLNQKEREFFSLITEAAFANPFSPKREAIDLSITGMSPGVDTDERILKLTSIIESRIRNVRNKGGITLDMFNGGDRALMKNAFLFEFFHRFLDDFDKIIPRQMEAKEKSVRIPFSREAISMLCKRGFPEKESLRYFELCYQLRRAFYFIDHALVGRSPCMTELRRSLWNNVFTHNLSIYDEHLWDRMEDFSTLLLGETGTGKGASAVSIGWSGYIPFDEKKECFVEGFPRSFVSINLSQYPETLMESELFGHKKGAFTGAMEDHKGVFDRCSPHGSIFLDEIGEVREPVQIKLLQVLQEREFSPVGSHRKHRFRGRVIGATNRPLREIRKKRILRDDFFYRLCSDIITVPPLRRRFREDPGELTDLLSHTLEKLLGKPSPDLVEMVAGVIRKRPGLDYAWPGNVRELEQCVRRILLKSSYEGDYRSESPDLCALLQTGIEKGELDAQSLLAGYCHLLHRRHKTFESVARITKLDRRTVKKYIRHWLNTENGNREGEAKLRKAAGAN